MKKKNIVVRCIVFALLMLIATFVTFTSSPKHGGRMRK
jgi:hypothetical protein